MSIHHTANTNSKHQKNHHHCADHVKSAKSKYQYQNGKYNGTTEIRLVQPIFLQKLCQHFLISPVLANLIVIL